MLNTRQWARRRPPPGTLGPDVSGAEKGSLAPAPGLSPNSMTAVPPSAFSLSLPCILQTTAQRPFEKPDRALPSGIHAPPSRHTGLGPDPPVRLCPRVRLTARPANHSHRASRSFLKATDTLPSAASSWNPAHLTLSVSNSSWKPPLNPKLSPTRRSPNIPRAHTGV